MARAKKDGVYINYYIQKDIKDRLDRYCEDVGQTNTMAIERILKQFLDEYEDVHKDYIQKWLESIVYVRYKGVVLNG